MDVAIRPPQGSETAACRLMLPDVFASGVPGLLVAVIEAPLRFVGAAAFHPAGGQDAAWQLHVHVVRTHTRRGIGRSLIDAVIAQARRHHVRRLYMTLSSREAASMAFLEAAGFQLAEVVRVFETDADVAWCEVDSLFGRLRDRGRIPADVRIMSLLEAPREDVAQLLAAPAGGATSPAEDDINFVWSDGWCRASVLQVSPVVVHRGRAIAAVVAERAGDVATVAWRVVVPEHRSGWANIVLGHAAIEWMRKAGVKRIRFRSTSVTPDTERMARAFGAPEAAVTLHYALGLEETTCVA